MGQQHHIGGITRRRALALAGGFAAAPLSAVASAAAEAVAVGNTTAIMTRPIPSTGERLPVIGLGTDDSWRFDLPSIHAQFADVVRALAAGGGSVVDTASNYGGPNGGGYGIAEAMLGEIIAENGLRPHIFIADKVERVVAQAMQAALQRMRVSKIDLIQAHSVASADLDLAPLRDWKAQGLTRYIGFTTDSNYAFDIVEALMRRWKPDFIQLDYSIRNRKAERRLLPLATELGVAVLINLPFGGHSWGNLFSAVRGKTLPEWASEFDAATWAQFFLKYVLGNDAVTAVIPGTDKAVHMADNLGAGRGRLPDAAQRQQMVQFMEALG